MKKQNKSLPPATQGGKSCSRDNWVRYCEGRGLSPSPKKSRVPDEENRKLKDVKQKITS